jgi:hypothetical protein
MAFWGNFGKKFSGPGKLNYTGNEFSKLPPELLFEICAYLEYDEIVCFFLTCKKICSIDSDAMWNALLKRRFPRSLNSADEDSRRSPKQRFCRLTAPVFPVADFDIVWLNGTYWDLQRTPNSTFGNIARLNSVCWLQANYTKLSVARGEYQVFWRIRGNGTQSLSYGFTGEYLPFRADPVNAIQGETGCEARLPFKTIVSSNWYYLSSETSSLVIKKSVSDVVFKVEETESNWKGPLSFDCVVLVPVKNGVLLKGQAAYNSAEALRVRVPKSWENTRQSVKTLEYY